MFRSHVMAEPAYLWPDWNLMKFFNEQPLCDSLWRAGLNSHTHAHRRACTHTHTPVMSANVCVICQCASLSVLQEVKLFVRLGALRLDVGAYVSIEYVPLSVCCMSVCVRRLVWVSSPYRNLPPQKSLISVTGAWEGLWEVTGEFNTPKTGLAQHKITKGENLKVPCSIHFKIPIFFIPDSIGAALQD